MYDIRKKDEYKKMSDKAKICEDAMKLYPIYDVMFCKMAEDINFCKEILQVILNDKRLIVTKRSNTPQYNITNMRGRSCILDLKCKLEEG